jgi:hypothetical protein
MSLGKGNIRKGINTRYKRKKAVVSEDNHLHIVQCYTRVLIDIIAEKGLSHAEAEKMIKEDGRINMYSGKLNGWSIGNAYPYVNVYSLFVMADVLGVKLSDMITVHYPDEKEKVRGVLRNPDYM